MVELLTTFGRAFEASAALALPAAFAWGVLSVLLSPCHLSSIPLVVAYMSGGDELPTGRRAVVLSGSFALGILGSVAAVGVATAAAGRTRSGCCLARGVFQAIPEPACAVRAARAAGWFRGDGQSACPSWEPHP